jgi:hypothetical protein
MEKTEKTEKLDQPVRMDKTEKTAQLDQPVRLEKTAQLDPKAMLAHLVLMDKMERL